jgi:hypothetical protein
MKQHKTPCAECPFRRKAPAGWLGGFTPDEFAYIADREQRMPCHLTMASEGASYADPGDATQCAGRAIFWANQCKRPRVAGEILELPSDTGTVFQWRHEFLAHHKRGPLVERRPSAVPAMPEPKRRKR